MKVAIDGLPTFKPVGVSRIGINVPVFTDFNPITGLPQLAAGSPEFPPFKLLLGADAPLVELEELFEDLLGGQDTRFDMTVTLYPESSTKAGQELLILEMDDAIVTGFSGGAFGTPSVVILPDRIALVQPASLTQLLYQTVDLPVLASPTFNTTGAGQQVGVYRIGGGEMSVPSAFAPVPDVSELSLTAVAVIPGLKTAVNLPAFDQLRQWVQTVLTGTNPMDRDLNINRVSNTGAILQTVTYTGCIPTRITFVNPALVSANAGIAPYVFDFKIKAEGVQ